MPSRHVTRFLEGSARLRTPSALTAALDDYARERYGLDLLGIWRMPRFFSDTIDYWRVGENLWFGPRMPTEYWVRFQESAKTFGYSTVSLIGCRSSCPFTLAEAREGSKRRHWPADWIFDLLGDFGYRDGLYCAYREWTACFVSGKLLALPPVSRVMLSAASQAVVGRLETIVKKQRNTKHKRVALTAREQEILQQRAFLGNAELAAKLGLSVDTVDTHLKNVRRKLGVGDTGRALLEAVKRGLIVY